MRNIELLAPAGGPEQFRAAVNAGCDAVYLGGSLFNARIGAGNFTLDEIKDALDYGHLRGVRTFVTMNTLMDDKDIPRAVKFASQLYEMGVDALIIQDYGLGYAIREALPGMELHLSTQATISSPEGVIAAQKMGYKRTVLSRELTLDEIRACAEAGEIEVFIHGALCICYSGQCQLSRYIGGRSGNKGLCAQPCRLPYTYRDKDGNLIPDTHPLSPKDLCTIDHLGELIDAGVASFKIEGRMKSPEYVATVVSIYRKYIDEYLAKGSYTVSREDKTALLQAFNREGFTEGYLYGDPGSSLMTHTISKNTGVPAGTVAYYKKNSPTIEISPSTDISMHDVLEIHSAERSSFKVTYLEKLKNGNLLIGDIKAPAYKGDKVYRLISKELTDKSLAIAEDERKAKVDMTLLAKKGLPVKLTVKDAASGASLSVSDPEFTAEEARRAPVTEADIIKQLKKTGDTPFRLEKADIIMDPDVFLPVSALNSLRRKALTELENKVISGYHHSLPERVVLPDLSLPELLSHDRVSDTEDHAVILPQVTKGEYDQWLRDNLNNLSSRAESQGNSIVVNSPAWIAPLKGLGARVIGGPGLNITNLYSVKALMEIGMSPEFIKSPELLDKNQMDGVPLMISEHRLTPGTLTDRKGAKYSVEYDDTTHKSFIFAE